MAPIITLLVTSIIARSLGWAGVDYVDSWPEAVAVGLAAMFVLTGVAHFVNPVRRDMIAIVPPELPAPGLLVTITGVLEVLGAIGLLIPATRVAAAICLLLLLLAVFPANIRAARMPDSPESMKTRLDVRAIEQAVYLFAAVAVGFAGIH